MTPPRKAAAKRPAKKAAKRAPRKKAAAKKALRPQDLDDDILAAELLRRGLVADNSSAFLVAVTELHKRELIDERHEAHIALGRKLAAIIDSAAFAGDPNAALVREFRQTVNDLLAPEEVDDNDDEDEVERIERYRRLIDGE